MKFLEQIWKAIIQRSLSSGPLEVTVFLLLILLFIVFLTAVNKRRRMKEQKVLRKAYEIKWKRYLKRFDISQEEAEFLTQLARYLAYPEKRYVLLVDSHVFNACLRKYLQHEDSRDDLVRSILYKAGLKPISEELRAIAFSRRKLSRRKVNIEATVAPIGVGGKGMAVMLYDLSSKGASTDNPERRFSEGDDLTVSFTFQDRRYRNIGAEVVRVSRMGERLHLKFHRRDI